MMKTIVEVAVAIDSGVTIATEACLGHGVFTAMDQRMTNNCQGFMLENQAMDLVCCISEYQHTCIDDIC